jgi:hypothetical protein
MLTRYGTGDWHAEKVGVVNVGFELLLGSVVTDIALLQPALQPCLLDISHGV